MRLMGKIAIITGSGSGIGKGIALTFAREGADVVVADIDQGAAEKDSEEISAIGRKVLPVKVDVSNFEQVTLMVEKSIEKFKKLDILINNAGITWMAPAEDESEYQFDMQIGINLKGTFLCCQTVAKQMIKQGWGKIVNVASISAHRGMFDLAAYSASKGGVVSLSRALAVSWAKYNINVNIVSPGFTLTPIVEAATQSVGINLKDFIRDRTKAIPLKRANASKDLANAVLFLASTEADNITGQEIIVDGGSLALHPGCVPALMKQ